MRKREKRALRRSNLGDKLRVDEIGVSFDDLLEELERIFGVVLRDDDEGEEFLEDGRFRDLVSLKASEKDLERDRQKLVLEISVFGRVRGGEEKKAKVDQRRNDRVPSSDSA